MNELTPAQFAVVEGKVLYALSKRRDLGREHRDITNLVIEHSLHIGRMRARITQRMQERAVPDRKNRWLRLGELLQLEILHRETYRHPDDPSKSHDIFFFNFDFASWKPPLQKGLKRGKRMARNDLDPVEEQVEMQYGELPEYRELENQFYLDKLAGKVFIILCADAIAARVTGTPAADEGSSAALVSAGPERAFSPTGGHAGIPPSPGAQLLSSSPVRMSWAEIMDAVNAGAMTMEEAKARIAQALPERAADQTLPCPAKPAQPKKKLVVPAVSRAPEKSAAAWSLVSRVDTQGRLAKDVRCGHQWRELCNRDPDWVLEVLPGALQRALAKYKSLDNPLGYLAVKAVNSGKMAKLDSPEIEALMIAGTTAQPPSPVGNLPTGQEKGAFSGAVGR